jgi:hypothetical protein
MSSHETIQKINASHKNAECFYQKGYKGLELVT